MSCTTLPRGRGQALAALVAMLGCLALAAPDARAAVTPSAIDPATGFPFAYSDDVSLHSLELCLDGPPLCINTLRPHPDQPASVPDNFPPDGEAFWFDAEAKLDAGDGGTATLVMSQEATFDTTPPTPAAGHQIVFQRIRVKVTDLAPGARYHITHPYGTEDATADDKGLIFLTDDVGCLAAPCDFAASPTGRLSTFLEWDPNVLPLAPKGYLGDPNVDHQVIGSPNGTNVFSIEGPDAGGPGNPVASTDLFAVQGKESGPPPPPAPHPILSARSLAFGSREVGAASAPQTVTVTNRGSAALAVGTLAMGGLDPADFVVTADGCSGRTLGPTATCSATVAFAPAATGDRTAVLTIPDTSRTGPHTVALAGVGAPGPVPAPIVVIAPPAPTGSATGTAGAGSGSGTGATGAGAGVPGTSARPLRATGVSTRARIRIAAARRSGIAVRFRIPAGARVARVELLRGGTRVGAATVRGTGVKVVRFRRGLRIGRYSVRIRVGPTLAALGPAVGRSVRVVG